MFKSFFAAIIIFFNSLFGISGTTKPVPKPEPTPVPPVQQIETEDDNVLRVGDYLDIHNESPAEATARLIQTNGNKFTVEITVKYTPGATVVILENNTAHTYNVPNSGILTTNILTNTIDISISIL